MRNGRLPGPTAPILGRAAPERPRGRHAIRPLAVMLAALALLWQGLVVQAHVHVAVDASFHAGACAGAPAHRLEGHEHGDGPAACTLCRELAQAGSLLVPLAAPLPPAAALFDRVDPPSVPASARRYPSHSWRGRGPPPSPDAEA